MVNKDASKSDKTVGCSVVNNDRQYLHKLSGESSILTAETNAIKEALDIC